MWILEGEFRDPEAANNHVETTFQQRWLRPARVYSLGRDVLNDFSREKPKTLSRHRSITFNAGPFRTGELQDPNEPPEQYSLTLTNHSLKDLFLTRDGSEPKTLIKSESPLTVKSGDIITFDPSPGSIRFLWRPVNLCFSLLKPEKHKSNLLFHLVYLQDFLSRYRDTQPKNIPISCHYHWRQPFRSAVRLSTVFSSFLIPG